MTKKEGYFILPVLWIEEPWRISTATPGRCAGTRRAERRCMVKVYSNCPTAELFVNGESAGTRQRNSQDFPAAGLRWMVKLSPGKNYLRVVAGKNGVTVSDEIEFEYQIPRKSERPARWRSPESLATRISPTIEATLFDANGVLCLDAKNVVRFSLAGCGLPYRQPGHLDRLARGAALQRPCANIAQAQWRRFSSGGGLRRNRTRVCDRSWRERPTRASVKRAGPASALLPFVELVAGSAC